MMQSYREHNIQELPLSSPFFRQKVERFLGENGLRLEELDVYCAIENDAGEILAGAGLYRDIIKCIAVVQQARSEGLVARSPSRRMRRCLRVWASMCWPALPRPF